MVQFIVCPMQIKSNISIVLLLGSLFLNGCENSQCKISGTKFKILALPKGANTFIAVSPKNFLEIDGAKQAEAKSINLIGRVDSVLSLKIFALPADFNKTNLRLMILDSIGQFVLGVDQNQRWLFFCGKRYFLCSKDLDFILKEMPIDIRQYYEGTH